MTLMPVDITPVTSECVVAAANHYMVKPALILSVLQVEGGRVGAISKNSNGSVDIGPMQINSIHLAQLEKFGIGFEQLKNDGCLNVYIGAYLLKKAEVGIGATTSSPAEFWRAVGNYHSKTPQYNFRYAIKVAKAASGLPKEWQTFDCQAYRACGTTPGAVASNVGVSAPGQVRIAVDTGQARPSFQALRPYK